MVVVVVFVVLEEEEEGGWEEGGREEAGALSVVEAGAGAAGSLPALLRVLRVSGPMMSRCVCLCVCV